MSGFPPALEAAISALLEGVSRKDLVGHAEKLSAAYRAGQSSAQVTAKAQVLAYLLARMPATFAAVAAVLAEAARVAKDFAPKSLLDVGAGPGTAAHAAMAAFPSLSAITLLEPNLAFREMAAQLLPQAHVMAASLEAPKPHARLVIAAYVLAELPQDRAAAIARDLWAVTDGMLVLVEPGTPAGFARIRAARQALIESGAHIGAPCTHDKPCPMSGNDWCHFSVRLPRSRDHMRLKNASVPFEDERYCYVVAMREKFSSGARIIKPPVESRAGMVFPVCDETGLHDMTVPSRDKDGFRAVRKKDWGDLL